MEGIQTHIICSKDRCSISSKNHGDESQNLYIIRHENKLLDFGLSEDSYKLSNTDESDPERQCGNMTSAIQSPPRIHILVVIDHFETRQRYIVPRYMKLGNLELNDGMFRFEKIHHRSINQRLKNKSGWGLLHIK